MILSIIDQLKKEIERLEAELATYREYERIELKRRRK